LEDRVQAKTQALQQKNQALEAEQMFSQGLLDSHKQFIRYAIHETHTPLSVIMANIELFTMNEGRNRYLAKIEAAVSSDIEACLFWVKSASQKIEDVHKIFEAYYRERKKVMDLVWVLI
jgi:signal transduction histidine kinase